MNTIELWENPRREQLYIAKQLSRTAYRVPDLDDLPRPWSVFSKTAALWASNAIDPEEVMTRVNLDDIGGILFQIAAWVPNSNPRAVSCVQTRSPGPTGDNAVRYLQLDED